jgi:hypothetical protein
VAGTQEIGPVDGEDDRSKRVFAELAKPVSMPFANETPLDDVLKYLKTATTNPAFPEGLQIYLDPVGLQEAECKPTSPVSINVEQVPLRTSLRLLLEQLHLDYRVKDGVIMIRSQQSIDEAEGPVEFRREGGFGADMGGEGGMMAGMGGGPVPPGGGGMRLNATAAVDQAEELRVSDRGNAAKTPAEKDGPGVTFKVPNPLDIPSRGESQLLELARVDMPAEYFAKAVPVLTPRVYRLAKVTNKSEVVLLPGEAMVYEDGEFVGKMPLPMVAAGEPFIAGFGVDPQVLVSRRLVSKTRTVKGGNQVFDYQFRIGLRNYREQTVKVQLWDRLPKPRGEAVGMNLVKTSAMLSTDAAYERTARADQLLRWDLELPKGTIGDKTLYVNYEFQLEYARELPQPKFVSGGLREGPIGGGAMGMGGMGGGMGGGFR